MQIYLARNNQQAGPYTLDEINSMLADGQVEQTDLMWHEGMENWQSVSERTAGLTTYNGHVPTQNSTEQAENDSGKVTLGRGNTQRVANKEKKVVKTNWFSGEEHQPKITKNDAIPATKTQRVSASMLDLALLLACFVPLFGYASVIRESQKKYIEQLKSADADIMSIAQQTSIELSKHIPDSTIMFTVFMLFAYMSLQIIIVLTKSQTIGKAVVGIRVVDIHTNKVTSFSNLILKRTLIVAFLFFILGNIAVITYLIMVAINKENRIFYDRWSKTVLHKAHEDQLKK